jgi:hypothetical protein
MATLHLVAIACCYAAILSGAAVYLIDRRLRIIAPPAPRKRRKFAAASLEEWVARDVEDFLDFVVPHRWRSYMVGPAHTRLLTALWVGICATWVLAGAAIAMLRFPLSS